jgi:UDP-N-acetylglucosamine 2-epimerase (non-hydrolysing)
MIYFLIGTKAQLIKTFPVMHGLERRGVGYRYLDTVQHGPLCEQLRARLGVRAPDHFLAPPGTQIERTRDAVRWAFAVVWRAWRGRREYFPQRGVIVVHGDTLSTLIGSVVAWLCGQRVCHLEAGERTYRWLRPFPEEIIRRIVDRHAGLMLACGDVQAANLAAERRGGRTVNLGQNTLRDAVQAVAAAGAPPGSGPVLISIHRFETITSRPRMEFLVQSLELLAGAGPMRFALHPPTRRALEKFGLLGRLQAIPGLQLGGLMDYPEFILAIREARFLVTDGGGPQEESHFLGTPCLLMRAETERSHGNVLVCKWQPEAVRMFAQNPEAFRTAPIAMTQSPSALAVEALLDYAGVPAPGAVPA